MPGNANGISVKGALSHTSVVGVGFVGEFAGVCIRHKASRTDITCTGAWNRVFGVVSWDVQIQFGLSGMEHVCWDGVGIAYP